MNSTIDHSGADPWSRLAQTIYATRDHEINCDQAAIQMAQRFAQALSETQAEQVYPDLFFHFRFCSDCVAEYKLLLELAQMEADGDFAQPGRTPPRPDQRTVAERIGEIIERVFGGFVLPSPQLAGGRARGAKLGIAPVITQLTPQLSVTLDVDQSESNANLRSLLCTIESTAAEELAQIEGIVIQLEDASGQMAEESLDAFGSALFDLIAPGNYHLHFQLLGQAYTVRTITIP
ncbi:MAG: hypothetical protein U0175_21815 [Caldilineaceae bacterium]